MDRIMDEASLALARDIARLKAGLGVRSLVLVGLMGAGKSTVGRRLAGRLGLGFTDADTAIEEAAGMSIADIFAVHGETEFRAGEARVIQRLLDAGPQVLATGGGAYMNEATRAAIKARGVSVWLKADLETLMKRVKRRQDRPLLKNDDPEGVMRRLMQERYPVYSTADVTIFSKDSTHEAVVDDIIRVVAAHLGKEDAP